MIQIPRQIANCQILKRRQYIARIISLLLFEIFLRVADADAQNAQPLPERSDTLQVTGAGPFLIRPLLIEGSISIMQGASVVSPGDFLLDYRQGYITFRGVAPDSSFTFVARYQFIPLELADSYSLWQKADVKSADGPRRAENNEIRSKLVTSGSITRGVLAGSNRDASIESGLRLQIQGEITPGVTVRAALTDENTPLLPEGTTRRLDQFERVFIQFESRLGQANLGDLDAILSGTRFSSLRRKLQGASVRSNWLSSEGRFLTGGSFQAAAATSKGLFRSQNIQILDGVQGPYRLQGSRGEPFILVLPGSEKIYMDGRLLKRGLREDYTIDYTTGEVVFTPVVLMGSDKRVKADFEYTTNQFTRTFALTEARVGLGRVNGGAALVLGVRAIREADGDQFSDEFGLSALDSLIIAESGDGPAVSSGAIPVEYDAEASYTQYFGDVESVEGEEVIIYRAADRQLLPGEKVYRVTFSFVGEGSGSYVRGAGLSNGIVYEYVGPGVGQYEPIRLLPAPTKQELIDFHVRTASLAGIVVDAEWAVSRLDKNRLSSLDSEDDVGNAYGITIESDPLSLLGSIHLRGRGEIRRRNSSFVTFDRSRPIEFEHDWNLSLGTVDQTVALLPATSELFRSVELSVQKTDSTHIRIAREDLHLGSLISARRSRFSLSISEPGWPVASYHRRVVSSDDARVQSSSNWTHQVARVETSFRQGKFLPFAQWESEDRSGQRFQAEHEPSFNKIRTGVRFVGSTFHSNLMVERRREKPLNGFASATITTVQVGFGLPPGSRFRSNVDVGYRKQTSDNTGAAVASEDALLVSLEGDVSVSNFNRIFWFYRAQSERSAALQEIYIRTGQERGQYVWIDRNQDKVQQLDEFIPETIPGEGEYVRTFFPTDSLEAVTALSLSLRYERRPNRKGNWYQRIGARTVLEVDEKSRDAKRSNLYFLRLSSFRRAGVTLRGKIRVSQTISFFPLSRTVDLDVNLQQVNTMTDLASGLQSSESQTLSVRFRKALGQKWNTRVEYLRSGEESASTSFSSRSYKIVSNQISPGVSFRVREPLQVSATMHLSRKNDRRSETSASLFRLPVEGQYSSTSRMLMRGGLEFSHVSLNGMSKGLQEYELTEGRGIGNSWLWHMSINARVTEIVTATIGYDGRAPAVGQTIHTGRVQISARF